MNLGHLSMISHKVISHLAVIPHGHCKPQRFLSRLVVYLESIKKHRHTSNALENVFFAFPPHDA